MLFLNLLATSFALLITITTPTFLPSPQELTRIRSDLCDKGYAIVPKFLSSSETSQLEANVKTLEKMDGETCLQYYEESSDGKTKITRTEAFALSTPYFENLLTKGVLPQLLGFGFYRDL